MRFAHFPNLPKPGRYVAPGLLQVSDASNSAHALITHIFNFANAVDIEGFRADSHKPSVRITD